MFSTVTNFNYTPARQPHLVQGVKNNKIPKGAIAGGKGSFLVRDDDDLAKAHLTLTDENGNFAGKIDIAPALREIAHREGKKLTQKRAETIGKSLIGAQVTDKINPKVLEKAWEKLFK